MFELYAQGNYSLTKITETMKKEGLRNQNNNIIVKSRIHQLLQDPFYIGKNRWLGVDYAGQQATFISVDIFNNVQRQLKSKNAPKINKHNYLFKGFMKCAECKGAITWEPKKGIMYGHCNYWYYNCSQGSQEWLKEEEIIDQLLLKFEKLKLKNARLTEWLRKALKEKHSEEVEYNKITTEAIQAELAKFQKRLDKIYLDLLDEKITEEKYQAIKIDCDNGISDCERKLKDNRTLSSKYIDLGVSLYEISQQGSYLFQKLRQVEDKQRLLRLVFKSLKVKDRTTITEYNRPFEILAQAIEQINQSSKMQNFEKNQLEVLEPADIVSKQIKTEDFETLRPTLLPDWDVIRTKVYLRDYFYL